MEIGSFLELSFRSGNEYRGGDTGVARLNSGRAAIYHAFRLTGCKSIYIPFYQCDTVRDFLRRKGCNVRFYHIDENFDPVDLEPADDAAVLTVNYFGIMSYERIKSLTSRFKNSIIDNSQAFFARALETSFNVYSARKFIGVPDGAYVLGDGADKYLSDYPQGYSSDTSAFLLQRIEYGCEGKAYESRMLNEKRIDGEDVSLMSALTRKILDGTDYESIVAKRKENFSYACKIFADINKIDPLIYYNDDCVPMVYPLVCEDDSLLGRMLEGKHFQGHWWSYLLDEMDPDSFEYYLSRYIIPVTVDQRYGKKEIDYIRSLV
ncbi:MAG: hypothetical protein IJL77_01265 [Clostridia bacterium]|nr:hypothetical protein [Clostridia bacterium]